MEHSELEELLELGRGVSLDYDRTKTFVDLFTEQANLTPYNTAVVDKDSQLTYRELDEQSNSIAHWLIEEHDIKPDEFVAVMLPRRKEFVASVLGIMKAGAAYVPIDPEYPEERRRFMIDDCQTKVVIAEATLNVFRTMQNVTHAAINRAIPDVLAYMIYTSGSTGTQKGVMVTHASLCAFAEFRQVLIEGKSGDAFAHFTNFSFDASLDDIVTPLVCGGIVHILSESLRRDMDGMVRYFTEHRIVGLTLPTQLGMEMLNSYCNLPLRYVMLGGERLNPVSNTNPRLINGYGPTEFTVCSCYHVVDRKKDVENIPIGRPVPNSVSLVLDECGNLVPRGMEGELCLAGLQMSKGYWHREELTVEKFVDCPYLKGEKMYRTGDLVRWNGDGELEYIGRIDNQIKLRGYRIELGEIDSAAMKIDGVSHAVAMVKNDTLCLYYTGTATEESLKSELSKTLPEYMVPGIFIYLEAMPLTPNGKTDRSALPEPETDEAETVLAATTKEQEIRDIVAEALKTAHFGVTTNLISAGLTSISAMRLTMKFKQWYGASVRMTDLMSHPTVRELAVLIDTASEEDRLFGKKHPIQEHYPLTENQKGVYIDWERHRYGLQYNVASAFKVKDVNTERLAEAIRTVINAHPIIKMHLCDVDGEIMQRRDDSIEAVVTVTELPDEVQGDAELIEAFFQSRVRAFDLFTDILYRFEIYTFNEVTYLFKDIHHIVSDGLSEGRLIEEIIAAYTGKEISKEEYTFYDYALESSSEEEDENYFKELIGDTAATVYPKSIDAEGRGLSRTVSVDIEKSSIESERSKQGVTANSYILHSLMQVLKIITREERVLIAAVSNGRGYSCMQKCQGFFVKTLPVLSEDSAAELQSQFIQSISHEEFPLTRIVESTGIHPKILYVYQGELHGESLKNGDIESISLNLDTPKMPISIFVNPDLGDKYIITAEYDDSLYSEKEMLMLLHCVRTMSVEGRLVTEEEERQLIELGTGERLDYDKSKTFVDLFVEQAHRTPDNIAVVDKDSQITYRELDERSNAVAHWLIEEHDIKPNDFVAVMLPRRKEFVTAVLGIWKAGAAYVPIDPEYPSERKRFILADSGAKVVLSRESFVKIRTGFRILRESFAQNTNPDSLAYMVYTSGSTGEPKGVMIGHKGLVNYALANVRICGLSAADRIAAHFSFSFSAHIIDIYPVLAAGASIWIIHEEDRKDTERLYQFLETHCICGCYLPSSLASLMYNQYTLHLRYLGATGEKVHGIVSGKNGVQVINGYGSSEGTDLTSTYSLLYGVDYQSNVPIGRPMPNCQVLIVDKSLRLVPRGKVGELCFAGCQVGEGYWNNRDLTAEKFVDCPYLPGEKMYRTGDLVRWNEDGQLEYIGRIDNQIKLRGYRIELGEIETAASKVNGISHAVATVKNDTLCMYYSGTATEESIKFELAKILPDYMLPGVYIHLESMPLTPNGKTDRSALPEPKTDDSETVLPATVQEQEVLDLVAEALNTSHFGVTTNLVSVGMTSMAAMRLAMKLQQRFGSSIRMTDLMSHPTVRELAEQIEKVSAGNSRYGTVHPVQEYYPLTENQKGIYIDWERHRDGLQYNVSYALKLKNINPEKFAEAITTVIDAHSILKMRLCDVDGEIMQRRDDSGEAVVTISELPVEVRGDVESIEAFFQNRVRAFDLFNDTLYRFEIYTFNEVTYLFRDIHHIVTDGLSEGRLIAEIFDAYDGKETKKEEYTFYDYALESTPKYEDETYFKELIGGTEATVYPRSRDADGTGRSRTVSIEMDKAAMEKERRREGVTASNHILHSLLQVLKSITREDRALIAAVSNGRSFNCMQKCQGFFVKTLPVLSEESAADLQRQFIQSIGHEEYPLTQIVESTGIHPEILYAYQVELLGESLKNSDIDPIFLSLDTPKIPINITVDSDSDDKYILSAEFDDGLYTEKDMLTLLTSVRTMATEGRLITEEEEQQLIALGIGEILDYDTTKTFVDLFTEQAIRTPDNIAVVDNDGQITYKELDEQSSAVAHWLIEEHNIKPNDFVAVMLPRRKEFVTAVLGIWKAGAAYVPIDPECPSERKRFILEDCGAKVVLSRESFVKIRTDFRISCVSFAQNTNPDNLAYMIYTSGSTGVPKGVMIQHKAFVNFVQFQKHYWPITPGSRISSHTSFSFDASNKDLFVPLIVGASLYIIPEDMRHDTEAIINYTELHGITGGNFVTPIGELLLQTRRLKLDYVSVGGEKLRNDYVYEGHLFNTYGPTEFTIDATWIELGRDTGTEPPIGRPVPNTYAFVLDKKMGFVPRGVSGELCLAGIQISQGYWHREVLTAEKFIDCPYLKGEKMYRTGDLVRWNEEGQLEYIGRIDNQIKLRGYRIELGEIESAAMKTDDVCKAVAMVKNDTLCLYYTGEATEEGLRASLSERLPDYMVPGIFIHLETMPLTPNGKIDRKALPEPEIQQQEYIAPANERERIVAESVSVILGLTEPISVEERFVSLGGNSISAMRLSSILRKKSLRVGVADILRLQTVRAIAAIVLEDNSQDGMFDTECVTECLTGVPLHESARFSYLEWERDHGTLKNNTPTAMHFSRHAADAVQTALEKLFAAHPYLNVRLYLSDGVPYQRMDLGIPVEINHSVLASPPDGPFFQSLVRPYNLIESPLYRIELIESADIEGCWLFMDINHVICDGYSEAILLRDLAGVLASNESQGVETGALRHFGYEQKHQGDLATHDSYFDRLMQGISPTVFPSSHYGTGGPEEVYSKVPADLVSSYVRFTGITENNVFLTAVLSVLQRLTDSDDVSLTMGHSGRGNPEIAESVGMFVKTWPVVGRNINALSWREATHIIQEQVLNTSSLEYYPFERLLSRYGWQPEITFIYEGNMEYSGTCIPDAEFISVGSDIPSMTPVWLGAIVQDDNYVIVVKYDSLRYSGRDMRRLADCIADTVARGCQSPEMLLGESELLSESERQEILSLSSGETVPYDTSKTCVDAIVSNALRYSDYPAIVACDGILTYRELDVKSNIVANWLNSEGVRRGSFVAMRLPESTYFYIAALGIMKAGYGYIPMDITYPEERLSFMLLDSGAAIVLTPELMNSVLNAVDASSSPVNLSESDGPSMLLYTSGSTGEPKGAYQQHKSLWTMAAGYIRDFGIAHGYHYAAVTSPSYALSLPDTYGTLCAGATLYISGPELRKDISALADYINENHIRGFGISTALGSALINSDIRLGIEYMVLAGEKAGRLNRTDYALWNGLGSTETHYMSYHRIDGSEEVIPLGRPAPNMKALLLDSRGRLVPRGYTGELCIEGDQLVKGYWHREELTSERFRDGVYHTGDLAYWNEDGKLMAAGRKDNMVKVRGYRIELEEIERCAMNVTGVTEAAAAVRGTSSEPVICLFYTAGTEVDFSELERVLPSFMLPSRFVRLDSLPLNVRGKLDRSALPELKAVHSSDITSPVTATEQQIYDQVSMILGTDDFGVTTNLLKAGLSSIGAMKLCFALDSQGIGRLHVSDILNHPTVREIAGLSQRSGGASEFTFGAVHPKREYYPLTQNQLGVYIDWQKNLDGIQYNNPSVAFLPEASADDIIRVTTLLTDAHPYLKCRIETVDGTPMQHRRDEATLDVLIGTMPEGVDAGAFFQSRLRPFNLEGGELCRVEIYPAEGGCWLFTDLHHIITDGYSDGLRIRDVRCLLSGVEIAKESYTAYDYAVEEEEYSHTETYAADKEYFENLLEGLDSTVYPGTASGNMTGLGKETLSLPKSAVREGASSNGVTANVFILSRLSEVLKSVTREERVLLATVSLGRESRRMEHTHGFFVKTLPVVYESDMSSLKRQLSESISHQQYPYTEMLSNFGIRPSILYAYEGGLGITRGEEGQDNRLSLDTAKFPLSIAVYPVEGGYYVECEYDLARYERKNIQTLLHCLETMVTEGRLVTEEEERQLIELGTGERLDYDKSNTFVDLFNEQVMKTPDNIAVVDKDSQITYKELDEQSNVIAHWLIEECGIRPDDFVAVMLPRRKEFVTSVLGIWKAGAAYVPIDPEYPEERRRFMIDDCGAKVVITEDTLDAFRTARDVSITAVNRAAPDGLAYMIYTSGSTGMPKGAMLAHSGLMNFIHVVLNMEQLTLNDRIAGHRSFSFDAHIEDMYPILTVGGSFHIMPEEIRTDLPAIKAFLKSHHITGGGYATAVATMLLQTYDDLTVRFITAGGEKLERVYSSHIRIINVYGPTECTDDTSYYVVEPGMWMDNIPIGRPVANTVNFILDTHGNLMPLGATGELCIAGPQVSRGYWHREDLTAEKFVDCPYLPGQKMYKTGDLVRWNEDGLLEYIGRIDGQIKLSGYRIELGEIESAAIKIEGICQTVATVKSDTLCLCYTGEATEEDISTSLSETLPEYMMPSIFIHLETMPLTPNGKTDRSALPEPTILMTEYVEPRNIEETLLCEIIRQALGITTLGVKDNLKALGMTSIKAMKVMAAMHTIGFNGLKLDHIIKASDVIDLIRRKNNNIDECGSWFNGFDSSKPVVVLCCGVISDRMITEYLKSWRERYNIYVIQPVFNSWPDYLEIDEAQMLERYYRQLRKDIPENADVKAFVGFSLGGELSYHLAYLWGEANGGLPTVLMGDTMIAEDDGFGDTQVNEGIGKRWGDYSVSALASFISGFKRLPLPEYEGRTVLLSSAAEGGASENEEQWRKICPGIEFVQTKESHLELFGNGSNYAKYLELLES